MAQYVHRFDEDPGERALELLGGKGYGLSVMSRLGIPVPPGFTLTTEVCRSYLGTPGRYPDGLEDEVASALATLERSVGRRFGDPDEPLLLSVRSGARHSMPGMMDTVLDL